MYTDIEFFKRVRARYYVFSGVEPCREVFEALLEAKKLWEDKDLGKYRRGTKVFVRQFKTRKMGTGIQWLVGLIQSSPIQAESNQSPMTIRPKQNPMPV